MMRRIGIGLALAMAVLLASADAAGAVEWRTYDDPGGLFRFELPSSLPEVPATEGVAFLARDPPFFAVDVTVRPMDAGSLIETAVADTTDQITAVETDDVGGSVIIRSRTVDGRSAIIRYTSAPDHSVVRLRVRFDANTGLDEIAERIIASLVVVGAKAGAVEGMPGGMGEAGTPPPADAAPPTSGPGSSGPPEDLAGALDQEATFLATLLAGDVSDAAASAPVPTPSAPASAAVPEPVSPPSTTVSPGPAIDDEAMELVFWQTIMGSEEAADFEAYLDRWPNGTFAPLARTRLNKLRATAAPAAVPAPSVADPARLDRIEAEMETAYTSKEHAQAFRLATECATAGHPQCMFRLAYLLHHGFGTARDDTAAAKWYQRAADLGHATAIYNLSLLYRDGLGVPRDPAMFHQLSQQALAAGKASAAYSLVLVYVGAVPVPGIDRDLERAAQYMLMALRMGDPFSRDQMVDNSSSWPLDFRIELQRQLKEAGAYPGQLDGDFGPATRRAVAQIFGVNASLASQGGTSEPR